MDSAQTALIGPVWSRSTLFDQEVSRTFRQATKSDDICCDWPNFDSVSMVVDLDSMLVGLDSMVVGIEVMLVRQNHLNHLTYLNMERKYTIYTIIGFVVILLAYLSQKLTK